MKKIIALLLLLGLTQKALAQGTIQLGGGGGLSGIGVDGFGGSGGALGSGFVSGNLIQLNINFSPLPGSAGINHPIGNANYSLNPQTFLALFLQQTTNSFSIWINLGTNQATDGWIYQMADDGSLQPVTELTNMFPAVNPVLQTWPANGEPLTNIIYIIESWPGIEAFTNFAILPIVPTTAETFTNGLLPNTTNYDYGQSFPLTAEQVQSLAEGKWYAEVDYGDDKYLGNLMPMSIAQPTATITVSPTTEFPSDINLNNLPWNPVFSDVVVAPANNRPATVILKGSAGPDPFGFPLEYDWMNGPDTLADTTAITNQWHAGTYQITFEAQDGVTTGSAVLMLDVISPEEAVNDLGAVMEQSNLNMRTARELTSMLSRAQNSFAHGDARSGEALLADFQRRVRMEMMPTDSTTANWLIEGAQEIIEAVEEPGR